MTTLTTFLIFGVLFFGGCVGILAAALIYQREKREACERQLQELQYELDQAYRRYNALKRGGSHEESPDPR